MENATLKFSLEAGALVRGQIKGFIEGLCMQEDVDCEVKEAKGLLQSVYFFKLKGQLDKLKYIKSCIENIKEED